MATSKKTKDNDIKVVQKPGVDPITTEVIAQEIIAISNAMVILNSSKLKRNAITLLIQAACHTKISRDTIDLILNKIGDLKNIYIK